MLTIMNNKKGVALVSTLFFLIIVTMLATGAIMLSTVQMKVASSMSRWERGLSEAEGGINYAIPLLQEAHFGNSIPSQYCTALASVAPCVVWPNIHPLVSELQTEVESKDLENLRIAAAPAPSLSQNFDISIDIDVVGTTMGSGGGAEASWAYHGNQYSSSMLKAFRVKSVATVAGGTSRTAVCQIVWLRAIM
ncbi:MAG: hypothetical protein AABZ15_14330 [Nitrospirota bacterium]